MAENSAHSERVAFFDVDHTIINGATAVPFALVCAKRKMVKKAFFLFLPIFYILYRFFSIKMESVFNAILPRFQGVPQSVFLSIGEEAFNAKIRERCYKEAFEEIRRLKERGVRVVFATSSPFEAVAFLARHCDVAEDDVISTRFLYKEGVFTGKLDGIPVFSGSKRDIVFAFLRKNGIDSSECAFYSDSIHDLPLLLAVGRPVAVNPDLRLKREAIKRGWEIRHFKN